MRLSEVSFYMQPVVDQIDYEQAVMALMRSLSIERKAEVYDFVRFIKAQVSSLTPEPLLISGEPLDEDGALIYDITRLLSSRTAVFPGDTPVSITAVMQLRNGDSCNVSAITMSVHAGTHIDAPRHYADSAPGVDALDLEVLTGAACVVTIDRTGPISLNDVRALDLSGIQRLLFHTSASSASLDTFDPSFAYFTPEAANWLGTVGVRLVGTDAPSVDEASSADLPAHKVFLKHGTLIVENLDLHAVPDGEYVLVALPLKIVDCDASPARVILLDSNTTYWQK
jgi:arylformamidase